jgi:hypothetical protein
VGYRLQSERKAERRRLKAEGDEAGWLFQPVDFDFVAQRREPLKFTFFQFPFGALVFHPFLRKRFVTGLAFADRLNGPDCCFNLRVNISSVP